MTGNYTLKYYMFYNCYQVKSIFNILGTDCESVLDRFTVFMRTSTESDYQIINQTDLIKSDSRNNWLENNLSLFLNTPVVYVNKHFYKLKIMFTFLIFIIYFTLAIHICKM